MSAAALNEEVLEQLAAGDAVRPQESAKKHAAAIAALIDEPYDGGRTLDELREEMLARWSEPCEELLGVFFPLIEYADERALNVIARCMIHVAGKTSVASEERGWNRHCGVVALGRLLWALTTYSLHCGRLQVLAELSGVSVRAPYGNRQVEPLITLRGLRYPEALNQNAGASYENYREWVLALSFVPERYALFADEATEDFDEADLVLAMRASIEGRGVYCESLDSKTVRRFAGRARDLRYRVGLARIFRTSDADLDEALEQAFAGVTTNQRRFDRPRSLFRDDEI